MARVSITLDELPDYAGRELGVSEWITIDQQAIDAFGELTGEDHWTHTDPERASRETPYQSTIAQGFLTVSHATGLMRQILDVQGCSRFLNYGLDRVRFTAPVLAGARIRLRQTLKAVEPLANGSTRITTGCTFEIEKSERPAAVADFIFVAIP
jgi:acyl dehydratase